MEKKTNRTRPSGKIGIAGILLRAALILLCLIMLCIHLMGGLFAKYSTSGKGNDSARVAKFEVEVDGDPGLVDIVCTQTPNQSGTYTITVTNQSEVAVEYDMTVTCSKAVDGVSATIDGKAGTRVDALNTKFSDVGVLPVGTSSEEHTLTFNVNWSDFTADFTGDEASDSFTFFVTVHVVQVD